jgi:hypothetical protein
MFLRFPHNFLRALMISVIFISREVLSHSAFLSVSIRGYIPPRNLYNPWLILNFGNSNLFRV